MAHKYTRRVGVLITAILVAGCAKIWVKPGSTQAEFSKDRYDCLQQSQQQVSGFAFNKYGGAGGSEQKTNEMLFASCMNARGWSLQNQRDVADAGANSAAQYQAITEKLKQDAAFRCTNSDYAAYYAKTACRAEDITVEQLSDRTRITSAQKANFSALRSSVDASLREAADRDRKYAGPKGAAIANYTETVYLPKTEKLNLDLYNGKMTWGEYNQKRKDTYLELKKYIANVNAK